MKHTKLTQSKLMMFLGVFAFILNSCKEQDEINPEPKNGVVYTKLEFPLPVSYGGTNSIDLNDDGMIDFTFGVVLISSVEGVRQDFQVVSVRDSRVMLQENLAVAFNEGVEINQDVNLDPVLWSSDNGLLLSRLEKSGSEILWSGPWEAVLDRYLGVSIRVENKYHYGWIKISSDIYNNRLMISEYAFDSTPEAPILTGQKK